MVGQQSVCGGHRPAYLQGPRHWPKSSVEQPRIIIHLPRVLLLLLLLLRSPAKYLGFIILSQIFVYVTVFIFFYFF